MKDVHIEEFGFLSQKISISFGGYLIQPKPSQAEDYAFLRDRADSDDIIHPSPELTNSSIPGAGYERRADRPGTFLKESRGNSHTISRIDDSPLPEDFRRWDGGFVLGMLSLFYETKLQFKDWFHDICMPLKSSSISIIRNGDGANSRDQLSELFEMAYAQWKSLGLPAQEYVLNALYFHSKAPFCRRMYERFFVEYMAIDAIWKAGETMGVWSKSSRQNTAVKSKALFNPLISMAGVLEMYDKRLYPAGPSGWIELLQWTDNIYQTRNSLFHEGRWEQHNRVPDATKHQMVWKMHGYTKRLMLAFLGVRNSYTRSWWWGHSMVLWD